MTFLAIDAQKNLFTMQRGQLAYEQSLIMNRANIISREMGQYASYSEAEYGENHNLENDAYYIQLQKESDYLETRQDSLDTQITLLDQEISSMKQLVNNNIKSSCSLNLIGG